jgi:hypothetical protein
MIGRTRWFGLVLGMSLVAPGWSVGQDAPPAEPPLERLEPLPDAPRPADEEFPVTPPPARVESAPAQEGGEGVPPAADELPRPDVLRPLPEQEAAPTIIDELDAAAPAPIVGEPSVVTSTRPVWVAGHFERQPDRWVEEPGFWTRPLIGAPRYIAPSMRRIPGRIEWVPGHWRQTRVVARPAMTTTPLPPADGDVQAVEFESLLEDGAAPPGLPLYPGAVYVPGRWKMGLLGRWRYVPGRWVD